MSKAFNSKPTMLEWQWRQLLIELDQIQRHAADPSCPCGLADIGEFCLAKHALALHGLAAETFPMLPSGPDVAMLQELESEALEWHGQVKDGLCKPPVDRDNMLSWAREWRKRIEPAYYACSTKTKAASGHAPTPAPRKPADATDHTGQRSSPPAQGILEGHFPEHGHALKAGHGHALSGGHPAPAPAPPAVCSAISEARSIHQDYLGLPPDAKTGSHDWHRKWVHVYSNTLGALKCAAPPTPPPAPAPRPDGDGGLVSLKEQASIMPCLLRLPKAQQKRVNALAGVYLGGGHLQPRDYLELADYVSCLAEHHSIPDEVESLKELALSLQGSSCAGIRTAGPAMAVPSDIARLPLDLIDMRTEIAAEELLGGKQYMPEAVIHGEKAEQLGLFPPPSPPQDERLAALGIYEITRPGGRETYTVRSQSNPNELYTVRYEGSGDADAEYVSLWSCTCPAYRFRRGLCKHIRAVIEATRDDPSPPAPAPDLHACVTQVKARQSCPQSEWGTSKRCVNPYAVCHASLKR